MRTYRLLIGAVLVGAIGWSGWWRLGSSAKQAALEGWLAERRAAGWVAEAQAVTVTGYPSRFDAILTGLALADPAQGWAWDAPEFQVLSLAYKPNHVIAVWPGEQRVSSPDETVTLAAAQMRGSVVFVPDTALSLDRTQIEVEALTARSTLGWTATAKAMRIATRRAGEGTAPGHAHDLFVEADAVEIPESLRRLVDPARLLEPVVSTLRVNATLSYDAPWDRHAVEGRKPALAALSIREGTAVWGDLRLETRGTLRIGPDGYPEGEIDVVALNWRKMIRSAVAAGALNGDLADALEAGLSVVAILSGDERTLRVPLRFSGGDMALGPVPLGPAPRFRVPIAPG
jgi:hypothetical protein